MRKNPFGEVGILQYLRLLGITQSCRFQNVSLFRFLLSGEVELDNFKEARRIQPSAGLKRSRDRRVPMKRSVDLVDSEMSSHATKGVAGPARIVSEAKQLLLGGKGRRELSGILAMRFGLNIRHVRQVLREHALL